MKEKIKTRNIRDYFEIEHWKHGFYESSAIRVFLKAFTDGVNVLECQKADYEILLYALLANIKFNQDWDGKTIFGVEVVIKEQ